MLVILSWGKLDRPWVLKAFYWPVCGTPLGPKTLTHGSRDTVGRARFTVLWSLAFETVLLLTNVTPQGRPWKEEWKEGRMRELSDPIRATPAILSWVRTEPWVPPSFWRLTACPILQAPLLLSGFLLCAHWMCLTDPHHTHSMNTDEHRPSPWRHTYSHCHMETPETPLPATPTQGHAHITTPHWHLTFDCSRKRNSMTLESVPVHPFHLPSWPTPLPPVPGPRPLAWDPVSCLTQEPRQPTIESVSGQDLFLGKRLLTLQQLSIFRGSARKAWGWLVQAWPPDQPSPGRQGHGRESWVLSNKSNHPCLPLGTLHQEAPPLRIHISWPSS